MPYMTGIFNIRTNTILFNVLKKDCCALHTGSVKKNTAGGYYTSNAAPEYDEFRAIRAGTSQAM